MGRAAYSLRRKTLSGDHATIVEEKVAYQRMSHATYKFELVASRGRLGAQRCAAVSCLVSLLNVVVRSLTRL